MKTSGLLVAISIMAAMYGQAHAYRNDVVSIAEGNYDNIPKTIYKPWVILRGKPLPPPPPPPAGDKDKEKTDNSPEATSLLTEASKAIKSAIAREFPCLKIFTTSELKDKLVELKKTELVGPEGQQWIDAAKKKAPDQRESYSSAEEEAAFQEKLRGKLDALKLIGEAKYNIYIIASAKDLVTIKVDALSRYWEKRQGFFYRENKVYSSLDEARADIKRIADEIVDALVDNAADEPVENNEVCPFKGKVDVKAMAKRNQQKEDTFVDYCNAADHRGRKTETLTSNREELWQLERIGNPDTSGTMQGSMTGKIVREEVTGCHECASGRRGEWMFTDTTESAASASGLDTSTWTVEKDGLKPDYKDATIRLHFFKNGTYKVRVRAVSKESTKFVTRSTTAVGTCDNLNNKPKAEKQPVTFPLEQWFGPFNGTVRDTRLKEKQVLDVAKGGSNEEVTEYTIEFDLKRPEGK